eukprot:1086944_1
MLTSDQTALPIVADHQFIVQSSKLKMKLTPILDQTSPCTKRFQMITHQLIVDVMETFVDTHGEMEAVIRLVMAHALKKPESAKQYAELCQFINDYVSGQYSSKRWIIETADIN